MKNTLYLSVCAPDRHISGILCGLFELEQKGIVRLKFKKRTPLTTGPNPGLITLFSNQSKSSCRTAIIDMHDWPQIPDVTLLESCDFYFKRSYSEKVLAYLPQELSAKIQPYGYMLPGSLERYPKVLWYRWYKVLYCRKKVSGYFLRNHLVALCKSIIALAIQRSHSGYALDPSRFPVPHWDILVQNPKVFYQTRLWDPATNFSKYDKSVDELNNFRVAMVRTLKKALGTAFLGGIIPSAYAREKCPDMITPLKTDYQAYLDSLSQCLIAVTERGLHGSNGGRFPELFGCSKCVVSESQLFATPAAPVNNKEGYFYETPDQCAEICQMLLRAPEKAVTIAREGHKFYSKEIESAASINSLLVRAGFL